MLGVFEVTGTSCKRVTLDEADLCVRLGLATVSNERRVAASFFLEAERFSVWRRLTGFGEESLEKLLTGEICWL